MEKIISNSALPDTRPDSEKVKDYSTSEILTSGKEVVPFENKQIKKLALEEINQWYAGSCVPHAFLIQLEYENISPKNISRLRNYRKRSNFPQPGSIGINTYDNIRKGLSNDFPTPARFTEEDATNMPYVLGEPMLLRDFNYYLYINSRTHSIEPEIIPIDIAKGKAVTIFIYATNDEWSREFVENTDTSVTLNNAYIRHAVCLVPKGDFTKNGKRWLAVHDSANFGGRFLRYISYEFLVDRVYFGAKVHAKDEVLVEPVEVVSDKAYLYCEFGNKGDSVLKLQTMLSNAGKLEKKFITGFYGALTAKAVLWWQLENWNLFTSSIPALLEMKGHFWGSQSTNALKKINKDA